MKDCGEADLPLDKVCSQNVRNVLNLPKSGLLIVIGQLLPVRLQDCDRAWTVNWIA